MRDIIGSSPDRRDAAARSGTVEENDTLERGDHVSTYTTIAKTRDTSPPFS